MVRPPTTKQTSRKMRMNVSLVSTTDLRLKPDARKVLDANEDPEPREHHPWPVGQASESGEGGSTPTRSSLPSSHVVVVVTFQ